jgi:hypothetical protein
MSDGALWGSGLLAALSLLCLHLSLRALRRRRLLDDTPTSKTTGVFMGLVELSGRTLSDLPLTSFLTENLCVHFQWSVSEHWEKTIRETETDSQGNTRTRTRTESGWKVIASGGESIPFDLEDDYGKIRIVPSGAELQTESVLSETCTPGDSLYYGKGPEGTISHSTHRRRFEESLIRLHDTVYVFGRAREREDAVAAEIARCEDGGPFVISVRGERGVRNSLAWRATGWSTGGCALAVGAEFCMLEGNTHPAWLVVAPVLFSALWTVFWAASIYNSLLELRRRVGQASSNVDVMLKRRHDLITPLVETVKANAAHEASLLENLTRLRHLAQEPHPLNPTVQALTEAYPQLTTNTSFLALQRELSDTESRIALARSYHAEITTFFNTRTETIPERWICSLVPELAGATLPAVTSTTPPEGA